LFGLKYKFGSLDERFLGRDPNCGVDLNNAALFGSVHALVEHYALRGRMARRDDRNLRIVEVRSVAKPTLEVVAEIG
jgi:hypothetical protein